MSQKFKFSDTFGRRIASDSFLCTSTAVEAVEIYRTLKGADMDIRSLADHTTKHVRARLPPSDRTCQSILTGCLTDGPECSFCVLGSAVGDVIQSPQDVNHQQSIKRHNWQFRL